jgi:hypothetical protein
MKDINIEATDMCNYLGVILRNSGGFKKNNIPVEAKDKHALGYDP